MRRTLVVQVPLYVHDKKAELAVSSRLLDREASWSMLSSGTSILVPLTRGEYMAYGMLSTLSRAQLVPSYAQIRPDKCNGKFYENCDHGRKYSGSQIARVLQNAGQTDLLDYMRIYWVSNNESPEDFWAHEVRI